MEEENKMIDVEICPQEETCAEELKLPGMLDMAKNLMKDGGKIINNAIKGNNTLVSDEVRTQRWSVCQQCPKLLNDRCVECGCFMKVKVAFVTSKCPIGNW
jgi:hypothetical protein